MADNRDLNIGLQGNSTKESTISGFGGIKNRIGENDKMITESKDMSKWPTTRKVNPGFAK